MSINEMIDLINESSSDADTDESDATVDDLELPQPEEQVPEDLATFVEKYDKYSNSYLDVDCQGRLKLMINCTLVRNLSLIRNR
jgi:hypothetical protein